jgi:putative ATPase
MREAGYSRGYRYPHDHPDGWVRQDYLPEGLEQRDFYTPTNRGIEERILRRMKDLRDRKR